MNIVKLVAIGLISLLAGAFAFLGYMGYFSSMAAQSRELGPYYFAFESFRGPYSSTGPVFSRVYSELESAKIKTTPQSIGIYYDNPVNVPQSELRSDCGALLSEVEYNKVLKIEKFKTGSIPAGKMIMVTFPIKNNLSYMIGPMKGYPALAEYSIANNLKTGQPFEIYDMDLNQIWFVAPVIP